MAGSGGKDFTLEVGTRGTVCEMKGDAAIVETMDKQERYSIPNNQVLKLRNLAEDLPYAKQAYEAHTESPPGSAKSEDILGNDGNVAKLDEWIAEGRKRKMKRGKMTGPQLRYMDLGNFVSINDGASNYSLIHTQNRRFRLFVELAGITLDELKENFKQKDDRIVVVKTLKQGGLQVSIKPRNGPPKASPGDHYIIGSEDTMRRPAIQNIPIPGNVVRTMPKVKLTNGILELEWEELPDDEDFIFDDEDPKDKGPVP